MFVTYRLTSKRFHSLDDLNLDELKWPELTPDNPAAGTLNPSATRNTGGHGFETNSDEDDSTSAISRSMSGQTLLNSSTRGGHDNSGSNSPTFEHCEFPSFFFLFCQLSPVKN